MVGVAPSPAAVLPRDPRDRGGPLQPLLLVRHLQKHFKIHGGLMSSSRSRVHAVDDVSFEIGKGETSWASSARAGAVNPPPPGC